jgi:AcrR family transcriptional regulator
MRTPASSAATTSKRVRAAAIRVFARKGFAAAGLRELAAEAGLTPAALYHYMGSKEDLLVDIMRTTIEPLHAAGREMLEEIPEPERRLAALVELHVWFHGAHPLATLVTDSELRALDGERRRVAIELRDGYQALWHEVLQGGCDAGRFDVDDARLAAIGLLELCTGVSHWYAAGGERELGEVCALHADWALGLVRAGVRRADLALPAPGVRFPLD